jgi:hypothetical protein
MPPVPSFCTYRIEEQPIYEYPYAVFLVGAAVKVMPFIVSKYAV